MRSKNVHKIQKLKKVKREIRSDTILQKQYKNISVCSSYDFVGLTPMQKAKATPATQRRHNMSSFEGSLLQRMNSTA